MPAGTVAGIDRWPEAYYANSGCVALAIPSSYAPDLHAAALRILRGIFRPG
jgi:hypothetical protein